jgi:hypothetical protein
MKRLLAASLLGLFLASSAAFAEDVAKDTGTISGRISPGDVAVRIIAKLAGTEYTAKGNIKGEVTVTQGGEFAIKDLPAGTYDLLFFPQGKSQGKYIATRWSDIAVQAGKTVAGINYRLTPAESGYLIDEILVVFGKDTTAEDARRTIISAGCLVKDTPVELGGTTIYTVDIPDDRTVDEMIRVFEKSKGVVHAEPNRISRVDAQ